MHWIQDAARLFLGLADRAREFILVDTCGANRFKHSNLRRDICLDRHWNQTTPFRLLFWYRHPALWICQQAETECLLGLQVRVIPIRTISNGFWDVRESNDYAAFIPGLEPRQI